MHTTSATTTANDTHAASIERLARRRAGAKLGWRIHATVYVLVNLGLALLSWHQGRPWAIYPALGWGLGLALHGVLITWLRPGSAHFERMVERERQQLQSGGHQPGSY